MNAYSNMATMVLGCGMANCTRNTTRLEYTTNLWQKASRIAKSAAGVVLNQKMFYRA